MRWSVLVLVALVALAGCIDVDSHVELRRDGSGRLDVIYEIDEEFYELGVFDESDAALPVPLSEADFRETVEQIDGLRLRRYRSRSEDGVITVTVRLDFESIAALDSWYSGGISSGSAVEVSTQGGESTWRQLLYPGDGVDGELGEALAASLDGYTVRYALTPPDRVASSTPGAIVNGGRTAEVVVPLSEMVGASEALYWEVSW
jgi:hypothetical protein